MTRTHTLIAFALCLLAAAGCGHTRPTVEVRGVEVRSNGPDGSVLAFTLVATNPGDEILPLKRVDYRVELNGREVYSGFRAPETTLSPNGVRTIVLPAAIAGPLTAAPGDYRVEGTILYTKPGQIAELLFEAGIDRPRAPFQGPVPPASR